MRGFHPLHASSSLVIRSKFMLTEEQQKIRRVEAKLNGEKRVHSVFCNFNHEKDDPKTCPTCKNLFLTDSLGRNGLAEVVQWLGHMIQIKDYMLLSRVQRQAHLQLNEPCIERGGIPKYASVHSRGLLAYIFDTTIPLGMRIVACHACNNPECSNLHHLYWGTARENSLDARAAGHLSAWQRSVNKHGIEAARKMNKRKTSLYIDLGKKSGIARSMKRLD
jgi:hypothetical protein